MRTIRMMRTVAIADVFGGMAGETVNTTDEMAAAMVALGNAVYTDIAIINEIPVVKTGVEFFPDKSTVVELVPVPDSKKPAINDPKARWVEYAMASGMGEEAANLMTKADLMMKYSTRD